MLWILQPIRSIITSGMSRSVMAVVSISPPSLLKNWTISLVNTHSKTQYVDSHTFLSLVVTQYLNIVVWKVALMYVPMKTRCQRIVIMIQSFLSRPPLSYCNMAHSSCFCHGYLDSCYRNNNCINLLFTDNVQYFVRSYKRVFSLVQDTFSMAVSFLSGKVVYISPQGSSLLRSKPEKLHGVLFSELLAPQDVSTFYSNTAPCRLPPWASCIGSGMFVWGVFWLCYGMLQ